MRFKLPEKFETDEAEKEQDVSGISDIKCKQYSFGGDDIEGVEDCLVLNVYVPGGKLNTRQTHNADMFRANYQHQSVFARHGLDPWRRFRLWLRDIR